MFCHRLSVYPCISVVLIFLLLGCGGDSEVKTIDFARTIDVDHQAPVDTDKGTLRMAIGAMVSPRETVVHYHELLNYIAGRLNRKIELVQRRTYAEINEMLGAGQIDLAFICSGPYATGKDWHGFKAIAVPQIRGSHFYRSYLLVGKESPYQRFDDLEGKVFAFTDPDSNTGKLVPTFWLIRKGLTPDRFFSKTIYTYSHDNSILAVATGLVDGATVHEQIWEYYKEQDPIHTSRTRIIKKSELFGNPLMVASAGLSSRSRDDARNVLLKMHGDPGGQKILKHLIIDRFLPPEDGWYASILAMHRECSSSRKAAP